MFDKLKCSVCEGHDKSKEEGVCRVVISLSGTSMFRRSKSVELNE